VTHLCAPGFVLLAGTGAFLSRKPKGELSRFLLTRGLWLVFIELTLVNLGWTFHPRLIPVAQVIWAIGWSMVALAALIHLPLWAVGAFGGMLIAFHNLFDGARVAPLLSPQATARDVAISVLHVQNFPVIYPLVPWIGVMAVGYAMGPLFTHEKRRRTLALALAGAACLAAFFVLRALNFYGDPAPWTSDHPVMSFFNTEKYPPSLLFLLMTVGPLLLLLAAAEKVRAPALVTIGRVPFFFYVVHVYVIHAIAVVAGVTLGFPASAMMQPWPRLPQGFGVPLGAVYGVWILVILALYPACRWFAEVKKTRRDWWLSYV
jgi:uncharacterized membrane protein